MISDYEPLANARAKWPVGPDDNDGSLAYYKELAYLRGELAGALMGGNPSYGAWVQAQLKDLEEKGTFDLGRAPSVEQKQDLKDALAAITVAVRHIVE